MLTVAIDHYLSVDRRISMIVSIELGSKVLAMMNSIMLLMAMLVLAKLRKIFSNVAMVEDVYNVVNCPDYIAQIHWIYVMLHVEDFRFLLFPLLLMVMMMMMNLNSNANDVIDSIFGPIVGQLGPIWIK